MGTGPGQSKRPQADGQRMDKGMLCRQGRWVKQVWRVTRDIGRTGLEPQQRRPVKTEPFKRPAAKAGQVERQIVKT